MRFSIPVCVLIVASLGFFACEPSDPPPTPEIPEAAAVEVTVDAPADAPVSQELPDVDVESESAHFDECLEKGGICTKSGCGGRGRIDAFCPGIGHQDCCRF